MSEGADDSPLKLGAGKMEHREFRKISRRERLKLSPIVAAGAVLIPKLRDPILKAGMHLSDSVSPTSFRGQHRAETLTDREVAPLQKFPAWTLSVSSSREGGGVPPAPDTCASENRAEHTPCMHRRLVRDRQFWRYQNFGFPPYGRGGSCRLLSGTAATAPCQVECAA